MSSRTRGGVVARHSRHLTLEASKDDSDWSYFSTGEFTYPDIDICYDNPTPRFRERVKKGEIINTPYEKYTTRLLISPVSLKWVRDGSNYSHRSTISGGLCPSAWVGEPGQSTAKDVLMSFIRQDINHLADIAFTDAMSQVGAPQVDALVSLVELPETIHYGVKLIKKLNSQLHKVLRPDIERAARHKHINVLGEYHRRLKELRKQERKILKLMRSRKHKRLDLMPQLSRVRREITSISTRRSEFRRTWRGANKSYPKTYSDSVRDRWLEYRYSIMTTVYEFQDWTEATLFRNKPMSPRLTTRAHRQGSLNIDQSADNIRLIWPCGSDPYMPIVPWSFRLEGSIRYGVRAGCIYTPRAETWRSKYGFEWHRLPLVAWEVTKLSFVADWFLNTSKFYEARTAEYRCSHIDAGWVRYFAQGELRLVVTPESGSGWLAASSSQTAATLRVDLRSREVRTADMVSWGTDIHLGTKQLADLTALSHGLFSRLRAIFK